MSMSGKALVGYSDSDVESDLDAALVERVPSAAPSKAKRKLPRLGDDLKPLETTDDTDYKRTKIVPGEWLCHVFIEVPSEPSLDEVIKASLSAAKKEHKDSFRAIGFPGCQNENADSSKEEEDSDRPHISLTRPILVRAHERQAFIYEARQAICQALPDLNRFHAAFSRFDHLINDDDSRDFLVLEIGTGWKEMHALTKSLSRALHRAFRAKEYYEEARFHASIGYVPMANTGDFGQAAGQMRHAKQPPPLSALIGKLELGHGQALRRCSVVMVDRVGIKVGKRVTWVPL